VRVFAPSNAQCEDAMELEKLRLSIDAVATFQGSLFSNHVKDPPLTVLHLELLRCLSCVKEIPRCSVS
jgi:hypothetical protein